MIVADFAKEGLRRFDSWADLAGECVDEETRPLWAVEIDQPLMRKGEWTLESSMDMAREQAREQADYDRAARTHSGSM